MIIHKIFGLDLGTTNSTASAIVKGKVFYAKDYDTSSIPSVVVEKNNELIVGKLARIEYNKDSNTGIKSVKREMGKNKKLNVGNFRMSPDEISAEIIKHCAKLLNKQIDKNNNEIYDRVIITVPAYFSIAPKDATRRAGELAGLEVVMLLEEPTAAAINYAINKKIENGLFLIYDLGGGTFDVSIVEKIQNVPVVLATAGNNYLGGDNFDNIIAHYLLEELRGGGVPVEDINEAISDSRFRHLALEGEISKKELSTKESINFISYYIFGDRTGVELSIENFTRIKFEKMIHDKITKDTLSEVDKALDKLYKDHGKTIHDITNIILVGGSTKIPLIKKVLKEKYCITENLQDIEIYEPDLSVSAGAAYTAAAYNIIIEDENNNIKFYVDAPYLIEDKLHLSGRVIEGDFDEIQVTIGEVTKSDSVDAKGFMVVFDNESMDKVDYRLLRNGEVISETGTSNDTLSNLIPPTAVQNEEINIEIVNLETQTMQKYTVVRSGEPLPSNKTHYFKLNEFSQQQIILPVWEGPRNPFDLVIDVPENTPIGSRISVTVEIDTLANINLEVKMNSKKLKGEYIYKINQEFSEEVEEELENTFNSRFDNLKSDEEKQKLFERKQNIESEIKEAKRYKDDSHYNSAVEKYQALANEIPAKPEITDDDFDDIAQEIYPLLSEDSRIKKEDVDSLVTFGKRALKREDYVQAKACYDDLKSQRAVLNITEDPKNFFMYSLSMVYSLTQEAEKIVRTTRDSSIKNKINQSLETSMKDINEILEMHPEVLDSEKNYNNEEAKNIKDAAIEILNKTKNLADLIELYGPKTEEINAKLEMFRGRVSKA